MSGTDFLAEATDELYGSDPGGFTERRAALAAEARAAGDRTAAKQIAGLRKPTRPAWVINQLVRGDPGVAARLTGLGDDLRAAATALDGAKIRELSQARRRLIDSLIRQALQQAGEQSPPAALREDLTATFGAALADPEVARELAAGTLLRAVHRADFSAGIPGLSLVPPPAEATRGAPAEAPPRAPAAAPGAEACGGASRGGRGRGSPQRGPGDPGGEGQAGIQGGPGRTGIQGGAGGPGCRGGEGRPGTAGGAGGRGGPGGESRAGGPGRAGAAAGHRRGGAGARRGHPGGRRGRCGGAGRA